MRNRIASALIFSALLFTLARFARGGDSKNPIQPAFRTSDRCFACHNELRTANGRDVSIGLAWRSSIMANSARDPYWQASVRRESIDHPQATADIEDECSVCHMPVARYEAKLQQRKGEIFKFLPFGADPKNSAQAEDGVTCAVCHQISQEKLGTRESFNGGFVLENPPAKNARPEYGPFDVTPGRQRIMDSSTGGFRPTYAQHIRDSALCGTCHQLYTTARGEGGKEIGYLPEQMPYLEWLHSDYPQRYSCQQCHMPEVHEAVRISSVLGDLRDGMHEHVFMGGNFVMQRMLNQYRDDLDVEALPQELTNAADQTLEFLRTQSARIELRNVEISSGKLQADVFVQNLTGHKLPTAYPSRRAWLHLSVHDRYGKPVFESGALNPDGSIQGNDNDADPNTYEPHYREITRADQVEIYEPILKDSADRVTTGLLSAVGYFKDNRLLPTGFDKHSADKDIAVIGDALDDPNFDAGSDVVHYSVQLTGLQAPYQVEVELLYEPIGFRWAHNLEPYRASEPQRFVNYYSSMASTAATVLARAEITK
jgi:hypothetical protein